MPYTTDIERLNYYEGEYLGATDFQAEQDYQRDMRRRHNVGQHTWGIVSGLDLAQVPTGVKAPGSNLAEVNVYVQPGMAVDGFGREIIVLSKTQLTTDLFAAYNNPAAQYTVMSIWISYAQVMLNPPSDSCAAANASNAFDRVQETFALSVTQSGAPPTDDLIVVDGTSMQVPVPPTSTSTPPQPGVIVLPYDDSIPYQEFSTDDSTAFWYVQIGQVFWDSNNQALVEAPNLSPATGREYAGNVSTAIYVPGGSLTIKDRFTPSPLPPGSNGVAVTVEGSLTVDLLFNGQQNALIGGPPGVNDPKALSPLTVIANATSDLVQLRNPSTSETWFINETVDGTSLNIREITTQGKTVDGRIFVQSSLPPTTTPTPASFQNVGIGTTTPRNPLAVRANGAWEELLSFEDTSGNTNWHLNQSPQGPGAKRGLNFCESKVNANFRLFLEEGGNVGIGTGTPIASLDVAGGLLHVAGTTNPTVTTQGAYLGWNALTGGTGETDFINNQGLGTGGFAFMNTPQSGIRSTLMFVTGTGNVGIGTIAPQQMLSVNSSANVDQGNLNPGNAVAPGLTFGSGSGEGIASCRAIGGTNQYGLDFYTDFQRRVSINNGGAVTIGAATVNQQAAPQPGSLTINGNRTYLLGTSPDNFHWIMGCGTMETTVSGGNVIGNNAIGLSYDTTTQQGWIVTPQNWNLYVGGSIGAGGGKGGYIVDRFINRKSRKLERGDVVVVHDGSVDHYYGVDNRIPILEVEIANKAEDTRVCGIVDEPAASRNALRDLDSSKVDTSSVGQMVTLGAYAHCKADATKGPIAAGDLLTTSSTPGHAQKVSEGAVPAGAIIGKALGPLKKGKGIIPILVSHQ